MTVSAVHLDPTGKPLRYKIENSWGDEIDNDSNAFKICLYHDSFELRVHLHFMIPPGELDLWDYCLRKLFVLRATPLSESMLTLGSGRRNLIPKMTDPSLPAEQRVDMSRSPRTLEMREWQIHVNTFKKWPFRPMLQ
ncbi:hypothetical protein HYPSUDRAFT_207691 [Hypholoma sublateritium FD-334 SS-4]|uniref:Uncharacterized protein n=1 Tax=Hypholoma sublateritium (strain FD-334 SS-4) TaxID=945553 RepID=A0A0D2KMA0_HYPSF|nr:hypothetical protein HYPSUDRAFT_207691 [Hypholoma sublateritium FD-334 SS-4]